MDEEFDTSVDTSFDDATLDVPDSGGSFDSGDVDNYMSDTVDANDYADDFYEASSDIGTLMDDSADISDIMDSSAEIGAIDGQTLDVGGLDESSSDIGSLMDDVSDVDSTMDGGSDADLYQATPISDMQIVQEDGSVDTLENIMAANADTGADVAPDVEPYQATPISDMQIVQEDGSVDTLENIMAANADTDADVAPDVESYQATPNSDIPVFQEDGSVSSFSDVMSQGVETDDTPLDGTLSDMMEQRIMENLAAPAGIEEIKTPNQKIQEQIDNIMGNQNLSDTQKSALLAEMKEMLPNITEATPDLYASPLQEGLMPEAEPLDDGVPVKVLTLGGNGTGISHHDYQQELADLDQGIANWQSMQQDLANSLNEEIAGIQTNPDLSDTERDILLQQAEQKKMLMAEQWDIEATQLMAERDLLQQKANASMQDVQTSDAFYGTPDISSIPEASDVIPEIQKAEDVSSWINEINPNFDPYDWDSPYCNNCGSCAFAVEQRFEGNPDIAATSENIGTVAEMNALTGMEQVAMSPEEIQDYLISQGPGSHGIVGIDRVSGPGHWFNAYYDGQKVVAIDGQTGQVSDWPPDYGDVTNWDVSVRKEVK